MLRATLFEACQQVGALRALRQVLAGIERSTGVEEAPTSRGTTQACRRLLPRRPLGSRGSKTGRC
jgi:hypothetical protein